MNILSRLLSFITPKPRAVVYHSNKTLSCQIIEYGYDPINNMAQLGDLLISLFGRKWHNSIVCEVQDDPLELPSDVMNKISIAIQEGAIVDLLMVLLNNEWLTLSLTSKNKIPRNVQITFYQRNHTWEFESHHESNYELQEISSIFGQWVTSNGISIERGVSIEHEDA
jgi:hypothetical protein